MTSLTKDLRLGGPGLIMVLVGGAVCVLSRHWFIRKLEVCDFFEALM